jgi:Tfp pilus assembly pilus retraction ATPase PilT
MSLTSPIFGSSFRLLSRDHLDEVLDSLDNVSDFYFCDGEPIRATVRGKTVTVTRRPLDAGDIKNLVLVLGDESMGLYQNLMTQATPRDRSYVTQGSRVRHRVNLTINSAKSSKAVRVVMRRLESEPWPLSKLRIPDGLLEAAQSHEPGLVMILGATGSGKTSLLSGVLRAISEDEGRHGHIVTIEDPVEYTYDKVACGNFVVSQIEVGVGCANFADGLRAAMRMHPTHILVGEIRDPETAAAAIAAARSGHKVFATMHVSSVAEMFGRWSDFFPPGAELRAMNDLAAVIDFACYQTLEDTEKGFMPVQESLSLLKVNRTDFITMVAANLENLFKIMERYVIDYGVPHAVDRLACNPKQAAAMAAVIGTSDSAKDADRSTMLMPTPKDIPSPVLTDQKKHLKPISLDAHQASSIVDFAVGKVWEPIEGEEDEADMPLEVQEALEQRLTTVTDAAGQSGFELSLEKSHPSKRSPFKLG